MQLSGETCGDDILYRLGSNCPNSVLCLLASTLTMHAMVCGLQHSGPARGFLSVVDQA